MNSQYTGDPSTGRMRGVIEEEEAVRSFSYRRVQSDNSPFHIVQGSSVGFHTRVLRTVPSPNQYSTAIPAMVNKLLCRDLR